MKKAQEELKKDFAYKDELKEKNQRITELNIILNVEGGAGKEEVLKPAKNPKTPPELLSKFSSHNSEEVREAVAGNPSVNQEDLLVLKDDDVEAVRLAAYSNAKMPEDVLIEY